MKSVVLLYRLDSAAPPNNRRGGARPTRIMRLKVLRRYLKAWQAQIPSITLPLSTAEPRHYKCSERARRLRSHVSLVRGLYESYLLKRQPATLVRPPAPSGLRLRALQSAAIQGYRGSQKTLENIQYQNKMQNGETRMACET